MEFMVPFLGGLAILLGVVMICLLIAGICNQKVGKVLWSGENEILTKKEKIYSLVFIPILIALIVSAVFVSYLPPNGFPFTSIIWIALVPLAYYTVIYIQFPKSAKIYNMIWGFLFSMSLMVIALYY